jgi:surfeit locus 1 family protein
MQGLPRIRFLRTGIIPPIQVTHVRWRQPSLASTLPFLLLIALCLIAARWQWQRAEFKQQRVQEFAAATSAEPRSLSAALDSPLASGFERVHIKGRLKSDQVILLDNRLRDGQYGVDVYVPLQNDNKRTILLGLGWISADRSRRIAPPIPPLPDTIDGTALLVAPPASGLKLGAEVIAPDVPFPLVLSRIDIVALRQKLDLAELPDRIALLAPDYPQPGFVRDWQLPGIGVERHRGYALQWLSFAIGTLVFLILWHRPRKAPHS